MSVFTLVILFITYVNGSSVVVTEVATFLNTQVPREARVEIYDTELFFLLDRPYHFPPDEIQPRLNRRTFLDEEVDLNYDILSTDPDYLVVGPHTRMWKLYDGVISDGQFHLIRDFGRYAVYQRTRDE